MNYCRKLWPLLGFVMLLFYSCERDDGVCENDDGGISSHPFVRETRAYFEDYVSTEMEFETRGLHPGLIAPDWDKVKVFTQPESGTMSVDVPLWTEASYEGSFYMRNDSGEVSSTDTYYTAILQKLIVVKSLERDALSCYIATIIPDAEHATRNSSLIDDMFCGGDPNTKFSGTVMYSTVTTNYTIGVERYKDGMLCEDVSLFYASANVWDDYEAMIRLIGAKNIQRSVRVMTRSGEMGDGSIMLPEVVIPGHRPDPTPPPSLPPPPSPPSPWPSTPPVNNPPVQPPPSSGGGGSHSGGGTSSPTSETPNLDKIYNSSSRLSVEQKKTLEAVIVEIRKSSIFRKLLDALISKGVKIKFDFNNNVPGSAFFNSSNNSITFHDTSCITAGTLREELVHALQSNDIYTKEEMGNHSNKFNIEWEAHIFVDAAIVLQDGKYYLGNYNTIFGGTAELKGMHRSLMNSILQDGGFTDKHMDLYKQAAKHWTQYSGEYVNEFNPRALFKYIKK